MDRAAALGYLDIVQWLHENRAEGCTEYAIVHAIKNGHIDVVKFLFYVVHIKIPNDALYIGRVMNTVAKNGHSEIVEWLYDTCETMHVYWNHNWAAAYGYLEIMRWLDDNHPEDSIRHHEIEKFRIDLKDSSIEIKNE